MGKTVHSQSEIKFEIIDQENGLTANSISCILQDSSGFLWIGTRDGLNKYDGVKVAPYRFTRTNNIISSAAEGRNGTLWVGTLGGGLVKYNVLNKETKIYIDKDGPLSTLGSNNVTFIHPDRSNFLWIHTSAGGMDRLNVDTEQFVKYRHNPKDSLSLSSNNISQFFEDSKGRIWMGTHDTGLNIFNATKDYFQPIKVTDQGQSIKTVYDIYEDYQRNIWLATDRGLFMLEDSDKTGLLNFTAKLTDERTTVVWEDNQNNLWTSTDSYLVKLDSNNLHSRHKYSQKSHALPSLINKTPLTWSQKNLYQYAQNAQSVVVDDNNNFWIVTYEGLNKYDPTSNKFYEIRNGDKFNNLNSNSISALYKDLSGTLWLSTVGGGLYKYVESHFSHYAHKADVKTSLTDGRVVSFAEDEDNTLWVSTFNGGFNKFNATSEKFDRYKIPGVGSIIFDILPDKENIWLASFGDGLVRYNIETKKYQSFKHDDTDSLSISENSVQRLLIDNAGNYWVGTSNGLNLFDKHSKTFKKVDLTNNSAHQNVNIFAIEQLGNELLLGTLGQGIFIYNLDNGAYQNFQNEVTDSASLSNNFITSIHIDRADQNTLWLGTYGGGLNKFNRATGVFKNYNEYNGLPNDVIYGISEDQNNKLWFSTNAGLSVFNKQEGKVLQHYDLEDGLQANEFNRGAYYRTRNGEMLFGGVNGFNLFDPMSIKQTDYQPPMTITSFKVFDKDQLRLAAVVSPYSREISLTHDQNFISIEFTVLDFRNVKRNRYAYRLKGLIDDWTFASNERPFANYTNLDPGEYIFELKATNSDGVWLDQVNRFKITISPPFWLTWWFKVLMCLLAIIAILIIHLIRVRNLQSQKRRLNRLVRERTHIIQEQKEEIATQNDELSQRNEEILTLNESLEEKVRERTKKLEESHNKLIKYSLFNSHNVRAPLARLLGLTHLSTLSEDAELRLYIKKIDDSAKELDEKIKEAGANLTSKLEKVEE